MNYESINRELQLEVEEVVKKYETLKEEIYQYKNTEANEHLENLLEKLESLQKEIQNQYARARLKENQNEKNMPVIEKTIYQIIRSFNHAYSSAQIQ